MPSLRNAPRKLARAGWRRLKQLVDGQRLSVIDDWVRYMAAHTSEADMKMILSEYDDTVPLPAGAAVDLAADHPRLRQLRADYRATALPVIVASQWSEERLEARVNLEYFRGDNLYIWQYREWPRATVMKYFIFMQHLKQQDQSGLLAKLGEDGAFGCWTFRYPGHEAVSRDLLDSANEIQFLDRHLGVLSQKGLRVLDIGAGYGRMAYRLSQAATGLRDYCCVDAIAESTFLCEYYLRFRGCLPPARVLPLPEVDSALKPDSFDLALNIHSFSECTHAAIAWWVERLQRLRVPHLLVVPNDPLELLSTETDGSKRNFRPLIEQAGYELAVMEPVVKDPAVRELMRNNDHFFLFHRKG
jgi:hypothetical protein